LIHPARIPNHHNSVVHKQSKEASFQSQRTALTQQVGDSISVSIWSTLHTRKMCPASQNGSIDAWI
jgi:hypothetical protein